MFLYANGCSMTYGYELVDDPVTHECLDHEYRLAHSWPGRLCQHLDCTGFHNDSTPGGSNDRILRTTLRWVLEQLRDGRRAEELFVVIGWSGGMRREFHVGGTWRQVIPYHDYDDPLLGSLARAYRAAAWNDHESAQRLATQVVAVESFLRLHGVPYLFFDSIESLAAARVHARAETEALLATLDRSRYLNLDELDGNMAAEVSAACPHWKGRHPAEDGHEFWARRLAEHVRRHRLLSPPEGRGDGRHRPHFLHRAGSGARRMLRSLRLPPRRSAGLAPPERGPFIYP